jgi:hypothetical protein
MPRAGAKNFSVCPRLARMASWTLSKTDRRGKMLMIWKARVMPFRLIS